MIHTRWTISDGRFSSVRWGSVIEQWIHCLTQVAIESGRTANVQCHCTAIGMEVHYLHIVLTLPSHCLHTTSTSSPNNLQIRIAFTPPPHLYIIFTQPQHSLPIISTHVEVAPKRDVSQSSIRWTWESEPDRLQSLKSLPGQWATARNSSKFSHSTTS